MLVKPQFELGRERVGKGGVVRDPRGRRDAVVAVATAAGALQWRPQGLVASPVHGPAGNRELLLWLGPAPGLDDPAWEAALGAL